MSLKKRFLLIFLFISIVPLLALTVFTYNRYTDVANRQITREANNVVNFASNNANSIVDKINRMTEVFEMESTGSYSLIDDLEKYRQGDGSYSVYNLYVIRNDMKFICQNLIYQNDFVNGIWIFTPGGQNFGYEYGNDIDIQLSYQPQNDAWYQDTLAQKGGLVISDISTKNFIINATPSISFSKAIYDVPTQKFLGVLLIDCSPQVFKAADDNILSGNATLFIVKDTGGMLYDSADARFFEDLPRARETLNKLGATTITRQVNALPLKVMVSINYGSLYAPYRSTSVLLLCVAGLCCILFALLSVILANSLTKPIVLLSGTMRKHGPHRQLESRYLARSDEIGVLYNEYNNMLEEINTFIKEKYQNKLIMLDAQMKALEAQINSHFLYNTLESINSIAELEEVPSISVMTLALGNMFRYAIKTESELVSLGDEIGHVQNYISIQQIRFEGKFRFIFEIDENLYDLRVLKLILQPIVENSLRHGFDARKSVGTIRIGAAVEGEDLFIRVKDDGVGIEAEKLRELRDSLGETPEFTELGQRNQRSIGLKNIHARIALYYGRGYGLNVESTSSSGTTVTIRLPVIEKGGQ